ncbi:DNA polymerase Y family protein, partial [Thalassobaculum sp.]|uniref:Y-family DNA polymerase n=1 Tax=Thalassobaculum sp. TaxID=2022740 RepID=UPI0032EE59F7
MTAVAAAAERAGVTPGMALADARALCPALAVAPADPDGDAAALGRLALWCGRYSPWTAVDTPTADAPDGIVLDITGCAHLFGGEAAMLGDIAGRLADFGLTARLAAAPTPGAAWAVARHGAGSCGIVPDDALAETLAPLPLAALRLDTAVVEAMSRVGLKRVGDLLGKPAAPLAARFGPRLVTRLDQALGRQAETVHGLAPPPCHEARRVFAEPI